MPWTIQIFSGGGAGLAAGPARREPKIIFATGIVGERRAPVARSDSSTIRDGMLSCFACFSASVASAGKGLDDALGCCITTKLVNNAMKFGYAIVKSIFCFSYLKATTAIPATCHRISNWKY